VKAFLDTSVLIAAFYADHEHHSPSIEIFLRFGKNDACCAAHSLAEVYAVLTSMPPPRRITGEQALLFLGDVRTNLSLIALNAREYVRTVDAAGSAGLTGGMVYDAILGFCALKAGAKVIYTWNTRHFLRLPQSVASRVRVPNQA
jgi:predicted nucleic acid-binding protein